jgi:hydroxymethylpyrimidine pyrophosphatase-like HAD family hydrolase
MNGVLIYDIRRKFYVKKETLPPDIVRRVAGDIHETGVDGLLYTLKGETLSTYYERITTPAIRAFVDERVKKYGKPFYRVESFEEIDSDVIYFTFIDSCANIHRLYDGVKDIHGLHIEKYQDIYSSEGLWYMEIFADTASKYNAVKFLREAYGYDRIIAFGDNLNDLPMFAASDFACAVSNAPDEVKDAADLVIGSVDLGGVVEFLEKL